MPNNHKLFQIENAVARMPELRFETPINWTMRRGEHWAILGANGAGKNLFVDLLQRKTALREGQVDYFGSGLLFDEVKQIAFKDIHSMSDTRNSYYQQRWHATEVDDQPTVRQLLNETYNDEQLEEVFSLFRVEEMLQKKMIFLSSGELRKFLVTRMLLLQPAVLILDNPFIGLDQNSRKLLVELLANMADSGKVQIILLLSNPDDVPLFITHVLPVKNKTIGEGMSRVEFFTNPQLTQQLFPVSPNEITLPSPHRALGDHSFTARFVDVHVKYGNRTILKQLNWELANGEKWALLGENGAGKSTLLSLIYADNPQSYANTFYLFDKKRGTGESIWDIKEKIGFVSPEMHLYYMENVPAVNIVASGFFDSIGLFRTCNETQKQIALEWMHVFGIAHLENRLFLTLSSGEQRLLLLARAFVKDPQLLILDEPLHGLDKAHKILAGRVIEEFCHRDGKTLIYVTHYLHEIPPCVNKQLVLKKNI